MVQNQDKKGKSGKGSEDNEGMDNFKDS
jgi:hypothetical protein